MLFWGIRHCVMQERWTATHAKHSAYRLRPYRSSQCHCAVAVAHLAGGHGGSLWHNLSLCNTRSRTDSGHVIRFRHCVLLTKQNMSNPCGGGISKRPPPFFHSTTSPSTQPFLQVFCHERIIIKVGMLSVYPIDLL